MPPAAFDKFILLDRDGVLNENIAGGYVASVDMLHVLPGAAEAVARLNRAGYGVVVVSNQQGVAKGVMTHEELEVLSETLRERIRQSSGGEILDFLYCTHLASDNCACRKPKPGLLHEAQRRYGFDLKQTYFVGDSFSDMQTALNAGCPAIFVLSGLDADRYRAGDPVPNVSARVAEDLDEAARLVVEAKHQGVSG